LIKKIAITRAAQFRKLRNRAAHEPFFKHSQKDLDFAYNSMDRFIPIDKLNPINDLHKFCMLLVGTIWNKNLDVLLPVFSPTLHEGEKNE